MTSKIPPFNQAEFNLMIEHALAANFTPTQEHVLQLFALGHRTESVVEELDITKRSLNNHVHDIRTRLYGYDDRSQISTHYYVCLALIKLLDERGLLNHPTSPAE